MNKPAREVFRGLLAARLEFLGRVQAEERLQLVGRVRGADAQVFVVGLELSSARVSMVLEDSGGGGEDMVARRVCGMG